MTRLDLMHRDSAYIIAEAGVNHNGSADLALQLVRAAAAAGADAVKFQTFRTEELVAPDAPKAEYQKLHDTSDSQFAMLKKLELSADMHSAIIAECERHAIDFLSTPFDLPSLELLLTLGLRAIKIPSGELTNLPFLYRLAQCQLPIIISTGMATLAEIGLALGTLAHAGTGQSGARNAAAFEAARLSDAGRKYLQHNVVVLHCTSAYPAPLESIDLRSMLTLRDTFDVAVGYSDHTEGDLVPVLAAALGARVIEKHFTLDRTLPGPDHAMSLEPGELKTMVSKIRTTERIMGRGLKVPSALEGDIAKVARKSLVAAVAVGAGELWTEQNLAIRRPGVGLSPVNYWTVLGTPAARAYAAGEALDR